MKILVTGANGFLGCSLVDFLYHKGHQVRGAVRDQARVPSESPVSDYVSVGAINSKTDWASALCGVDAVVHLAARVHVMSETAVNPLAAFREVNTEGTKKLAVMAVDAGVKRFIYVSSIKVNGEATSDAPFYADDLPLPVDPYGVSKAEAEKALREITRSTSMELVIIRPPLIYGPGVGGNFLRLMNVVEKGVPLPFGNVENTRSMVSLTNFNEFVLRSLVEPRAAGEIFLVSDQVAWSTPHLIERIAYYMGKKVFIFSLPVGFLRFVGKAMGQSASVDRLCESLEVNTGKASELLDWSPSQTTDEGIQDTVSWYLSTGKNR